MSNVVFTEPKPTIDKPLLQRLNPGWLIALFPLAISLYLFSLVGRISAGEVIAASYAWVPSLGVNLSFYIDGLSLVAGACEFDYRLSKLAHRFLENEICR